MLCSCILVSGYSCLIVGVLVCWSVSTWLPLVQRAHPVNFVFCYGNMFPPSTIGCCVCCFVCVLLWSIWVVETLLSLSHLYEGLLVIFLRALCLKAYVESGSSILYFHGPDEYIYIYCKFLI